MVIQRRIGEDLAALERAKAASAYLVGRRDIADIGPPAARATQRTILQTPQSPLLASTMRTLLLLLYGAGMRIGESLSPTLQDVDLESCVLTVREPSSSSMPRAWLPRSSGLAVAETQENPVPARSGPPSVAA
jgi:integrase